MQPTSNTSESKAFGDKAVADVLTASVSLPSALTHEKRNTPVANPSLADLVIRATRHRRNDTFQSSGATPTYSDLYGNHDEACADDANYKTPESMRRIIGAGTVSTPPQRKPRYTRRCSITKFSLQTTARVAVRQLQQEHSGRRSIQSGVFLPASAKRTGPRYKNIAPILEKAMGEIDDNCF